MKDIMIFRRVEKKYRLTPVQKDALLQAASGYLTPDVHGRSTICSLYLDTPDHRLIRNSIIAKTYKEKLRLRSYGTPTPDSQVFLEIKKKFKGVVYKRREVMTLRDAMRYIEEGVKPVESQIMSEIDYAMHFYRHPRPSMLIAYEREAYFCVEHPDLRLTFDTNVRYREDDLHLEHGHHGQTITNKDTVLLEVKTNGAMPLWLAHLLDQQQIRPISFSKYGTAYRETLGVPSPYSPASSTNVRGELTCHV